MHDVIGLGDTHEILEVIQRPGTLAPLQIVDAGRPGHGCEDHVTAAYPAGSGRLTCDEIALGRHGSQGLRHHPRVHADHRRRLVHGGAGGLEPRPAARRENPHSLTRQNTECGQVNALDLVVGEYPDRLERIDEVAVAHRPGWCRARLSFTPSRSHGGSLCRPGLLGIIDSNTRALAATMRT